MSDDETAEEILLKRHRKEKKDFQAKIQALKKSASKGDKKKKKEIAEEIADLEKNLQIRHEQELKELNNGEDDENAVRDRIQTLDINPEPEPEAPRVSKAQKRRDKKAQKAKDRLAEIELQDEANKTGARQIESDKIHAELVKRGLEMREVPSDGDCLFAAIGLQAPGGPAAPQELRKAAVEVMRSTPDEFAPFLIDYDKGFDGYLAEMADTKMWGGQLELRALSKYLRRPVEVIQAEGESVKIGQDEFGGDWIFVTYHRHMYGLGEHYNAALKQ